ncbi:TniQ family protein [Rhizobium leguminosarum]|uniref:TniQ family protein n=1 Tax=Rhizobium leguminosarum TaxID=384 RepID=UPI0013F147A2|nr:TniQ family protein [Rhizobium leguminosarum]
MNKLSITVPFHSDETAFSFCSRLAAANGFSNVKDFCWSLGLNHVKITVGNPEETAKLLQFAGVDDLAGRLLTTDGLLYSVNGERLSKKSVMRSRLRYCAHCIAEDLRTEGVRREARGYGRLTWCITFIRTCPKHQTLLRVTDQNELTGSHDVVRMIATELPNMSSPTLEPVSRTNFEDFIEKAVWGRRAFHGWMDEFPLYVVGRLCELVGASLTFGKVYHVEDYSEADWLKAAQAGFDVLKSGQRSFEEFLISMHGDFWNKKTHTGGRALYGRLYERLAHETSDRAFDPIRKIMYDVTLDTLPIGPGDELFGRVTERRIHSVHSAAQEFGIHPKTLRKLLKNAKAIVGGDALTDERTLLPKEEMLALVDRIRGNLSAEQAAEHLGVSRTAFDVLVSEGHIKNSAGFDQVGMYALYRPADLDAFVAQAASHATCTFDQNAGLTSLAATVRRANCKFVELFGLLLGARLKTVAVKPGKSGFSAIMFDPKEVARLTALPSQDGMNVVDAAKELNVGSQVLRNLIDTGWIVSEWQLNSINRCPQRFIRPAVLEEFKRDYVSLFNLAKEFRINIGRLGRQLRALGNHPSITSDAVGATFYHRSLFRY